MSIGLTLSGGGFRATLFHLGVIQYLRTANLLKSVTHIAAVSGGSIVAAHLGVNWDRYCGNDVQFREVASELINFTRSGVREHIVTWLPIIYLSRLTPFLPKKWRLNQTVLLQRLYSRYLFDGKTVAALREHSGTPSIHLAATNLTCPNDLVTFSSSGVLVHDANGNEIASEAFDLSLAVSASSAFPLLFPPVEISTDSLGVRADRLTPSPQYLSDGGIFDNDGLRALYYFKKSEPIFDLLIVSDAGARANWQPNTSFRSISLLHRAFDISGQRVSQLELSALDTAKLASKSVIVSIHNEVNGRGGLPGVLQRQLGAVRTDLDAFSDLLIYCLCNHGYGIAKTEIEKEAAPSVSLPTDWNSLAPRVPLDNQVANDMQRLQMEAFYKWKLFTIREWRPLVVYLIVGIAMLLLSFFFLPGWISTSITTATNFVHEFARVSWTKESVADTVAFGDQVFLGALQDSMGEMEKDEFRMNRWYRWLNDGIRPRSKRQQVLVIKTPQFDDNYRPFGISILTRSSIRFAEGVAYLVSNSGSGGTYRPVYRQMQMRFDQSGETPPEVNIDSPNSDESLIIILRAVSKSADADAKLPESPDSFNITLRTQ